MLSTAAKSAASNWSTMLVASTTFLVSLVSDKLNGKSITWPLSVPRTYLVRPSFWTPFVWLPSCCCFGFSSIASSPLTSCFQRLLPTFWLPAISSAAAKNGKA
ncbi:hypothetical protein FA947_02530 [Mycoplasmoides pneumoniae]|nr:RecName: Full=Uncharacterized protein MPN_441 [Mycoplasmoides pneumoniae M129]ARI11777.1 hypothetical protein B7R95_02560 [Mycoplasmoides pneumoniae]AAB96048.1 conserved hypothetical protein [Mycoplasmoides pneumoniae M129]ARI12488.1 hypothetical protein B7R97_02555 [Mycoplasmoides pneumoniae]ARI13189.1 hypothetical protein B7R98_02560 [Mycoplasmoides pneumoniae]ARI13895.1 hypothetical protein B7R99_02555 [Mycoplasmoides pneumoniae]